MPTFSNTFRGIPYAELHEGSGRITIGDNQGAQRRFQCTWANALKMSLGLRGWELVGGSIYQPTLPNEHPFNVGLFCTDVMMEPSGKPTGENTWEYAKLTAQYKPLVVNNSTGPTVDIIDESLDFSADMVDLGKDGWTFESDSSAVGKTIQKVVPMIAYCITQYHVTTIPLQPMYNALGTLNLGFFRGADPGFMLYCGAQAQRKIVGTFNGVTYLDWTVNHKFLYARRNLNSEWRSSTGAFEKIIGTGSVTKFEESDFSLLGLGN